VCKDGRTDGRTDGQGRGGLESDAGLSKLAAFYFGWRESPPAYVCIRKEVGRQTDWARDAESL
jgi:hypothetical protein